MIATVVRGRTRGSIRSDTGFNPGLPRSDTGNTANASVSTSRAQSPHGSPIPNYGTTAPHSFNWSHPAISREDMVFALTELSGDRSHLAVRDGSLLCLAPRSSAIGFSAAYEEAQRAIEGDLPHHFFTPAASNTTPWLRDEGAWSPFRLRLAKVVLSNFTEGVLTCIICFNVALILYETDQYGKCFPEFKDHPNDCPTANGKNPWIYASNTVLVIFYTIEAFVFIYVLRMEYFKSVMHIFDILIVMTTWVSMVSDVVNISFFRLLRCVRLIKMMRVVRNVPELYLMFACFAGSMKAMFFGGLVLLILLSFFGILMVQIIHPINSEIAYADCDRCPKAFGTIYRSMATLFQQIVAGDSWGQLSIPLMKRSWEGVILMISTQLIVGIGAMNLILAVIVDRAMEVREANQADQVQTKLIEEKVRKLELLRMIGDLDADKSGTIHRSEVRVAAAESQDFLSRLALMGIGMHELDDVFEFVEGRSTHNMNFADLCHALADLEGADIRKTAVLCKMHLACMKGRILNRFEAQDRVIQKQTQTIGNLTVQVRALQSQIAAMVNSQEDDMAMCRHGNCPHCPHTRTTANSSFGSEMSSIVEERTVRGDTDAETCENPVDDTTMVGACSDHNMRS